MEIFPPWFTYFYIGRNIPTGWNISTLVEIFSPWLKYLYPGWNIYTQFKYSHPVETFKSGWNISLDIFSPGGTYKISMSHMWILVEIFPHVGIFISGLNIPTPVETFKPGLNMSTPVEIFPPRFKYFCLGGNILPPPLKNYHPGGNIPEMEYFYPV